MSTVRWREHIYQSNAFSLFSAPPRILPTNSTGHQPLVTYRTVPTSEEPKWVTLPIEWWGQAVLRDCLRHRTDFPLEIPTEASDSKGWLKSQWGINSAQLIEFEAEPSRKQCLETTLRDASPYDQLTIVFAWMPEFTKRKPFMSDINYIPPSVPWWISVSIQPSDN